MYRNTVLVLLGSGFYSELIGGNSEVITKWTSTVVRDASGTLLTVPLTPFYAKQQYTFSICVFECFNYLNDYLHVQIVSRTFAILC